MRHLKNLMAWMVFISLLSCNKTDHSVFHIPTLPDNIPALQDKMVGQLSGEYDLSENIKLNDRWSDKNRRLARAYLKEVIAQLPFKSRNTKL